MNKPKNMPSKIPKHKMVTNRDKELGIKRLHHDVINYFAKDDNKNYNTVYSLLI